MQLCVYFCRNVIYLEVFMAYIYSKNIAVPQILGWKKPAALKVMWLSIPIFFLDLFVKGELNKNENCSGLHGPAAEICRMF